MAAAAFAVLALAAAAGASNPQIAGLQIALRQHGSTEGRSTGSRGRRRFERFARSSGGRGSRSTVWPDREHEQPGLARATLFGTRTSGAACAAMTSACCSSCSGGTAFGQAPSTCAWREDRRGSAPVPAARRSDAGRSRRPSHRTPVVLAPRVRLARDPPAGKGEEAHASHRTRRDAHRDLPPLRSQRQGDRGANRSTRAGTSSPGHESASRRSCAPARQSPLPCAPRSTTGRGSTASIRASSGRSRGGVRVQQRFVSPAGRAASCR